MPTWTVEEVNLDQDSKFLYHFWFTTNMHYMLVVACLFVHLKAQFIYL